MFASTLRQSLLQLPKDLKQCKWDDALAHHEAGTALMILLYYHYLGTQVYETTHSPFVSVISSAHLSPGCNLHMQLPDTCAFFQMRYGILAIVDREDRVATKVYVDLSFDFETSVVLILRKYISSHRGHSLSLVELIPLDFTQVTSLSHPRPYLLPNYANAVAYLTSILECFELADFYTHHIDLLRYCLKCPDISQNLIKQILNLWLIESDGDIKPLLSFNRDKVVHHLLASGYIFIFRVICIGAHGINILGDIVSCFF